MSETEFVWNMSGHSLWTGQLVLLVFSTCDDGGTWRALVVLIMKKRGKHCGFLSFGTLFPTHLFLNYSQATNSKIKGKVCGCINFTSVHCSHFFSQHKRILTFWMSTLELFHGLFCSILSTVIFWSVLQQKVDWFNSTFSVNIIYWGEDCRYTIPVLLSLLFPQSYQEQDVALFCVVKIAWMSLRVGIAKIYNVLKSLCIFLH